MTGRADRLGPALLLALLAVSLAVAAFVYRARTPDLALEVTDIQRNLSPDGDGRKDLARVTFFVRFDEPSATVQIVGKDRVIVRTLAAEFGLEEDVPVRCTWDGRNDDGELVARGRYRLRVVLPGQGRDMVFIRRIDLERKNEDRAPPVAPDCAPVEVEL